MKSIEFDVLFGEKTVHIEISAPMGAGDVYYVMINNSYNGRLWKTSNGWQHDLNPKTILQGDDVSVIIDLIEQNLMS